MGKTERLGDLELKVLWTLMRLRHEAYGMEIREELSDRLGVHVSIGAVYAALSRLKQKRYVSSRAGDPLPERGGRARRYYRIEGAGERVAREAREAMTKTWRGLRPAEVK